MDQATRIGKKVVFAPRAGDARIAAQPPQPHGHKLPGTDNINGLAQLRDQQGSQELSGTSKTVIPVNWGKPGRPSKFGGPQLQLPPGFKELRKGKSIYTPELGEQFIEEYYNTGGSITRAAYRLKVKYTSALEWKATIPLFAQALDEVDQIIRDEIHAQFMERVLNTWEPNPAWKFKYFNKHFPDYSETKKTMKVTFSLKDSLIRPDVIDGEVVKPKQLESGADATGSEQAMEPSTDSS